MSSPDSIADAAFIASALNSLKFWSLHEGKCMGITVEAVLLRLGILLGPTSEPISLLSLGRAILDYFLIQPDISSQSWWTARCSSKRRATSMKDRSPRDLTRLACLADTYTGYMLLLV